MTPTLSRPLRKIGVRTEQFQPWVELELLPALREIQQALNYTAVSKATIPTDGTATPTTLWTSQDLAAQTAVMIEASVTAIGSFVFSAFKVAGLFYNDGATVAQEGATAAIYSQNAAGLTVAFSVVANHVELVVTDVATPVRWVAVLSALEVVA